VATRLLSPVPAAVAEVATGQAAAFAVQDSIVPRFTSALAERQTGQATRREQTRPAVGAAASINSEFFAAVRSLHNAARALEFSGIEISKAAQKLVSSAENNVKSAQESEKSAGEIATPGGTSVMRELSDSKIDTKVDTIIKMVHQLTEQEGSMMLRSSSTTSAAQPGSCIYSCSSTSGLAGPDLCIPGCVVNVVMILL